LAFHAGSILAGAFRPISWKLRQDVSELALLDALESFSLLCENGLLVVSEPRCPGILNLQAFLLEFLELDYSFLRRHGCLKLFVW